jgi:hypothetical protein
MFINKENSHHCLRLTVPGDIQTLSGEGTELFICKIQKSRYLTIILDCVPDICDQEQMSVNMQTVIYRSKRKEHFLELFL